jgi:histidinol dehydrogenase
MIPIKRLEELSPGDKYSLFNRFGQDFLKIISDVVAPIVMDVKSRGDIAVLEYTKKFDGIEIDCLIATDDEIDYGFRNTPNEVIDAFSEARKNIEEFHRRQERTDYRHVRADGSVLGVSYQAINSAAVYVPGGKAVYPSSVLMGVIPAQIAGVKEITLVTPPAIHGSLHPVIGAMCKMMGIKRVIKSGGAQGIAAAGLGTATVPKSEIIIGPGNIFVTAAKVYLFSMGMVQIDSPAGPSEVLIVADDTADPDWVACDMLSQAEHDEMACSILVTTSESLAAEVQKRIELDIKSGSGRSEIKKASIEKNGLIIISSSIKEAIKFSNSYAPEHMELAVNDPESLLPLVRNVGSLFLGHYAPVAIGDYYSGTNHILPTGGATRFSSGTSVDTFIRRMTYQMPSREGIKIAAGPVSVMSSIEGFDEKHGESVRIRAR